MKLNSFPISYFCCLSMFIFIKANVAQKVSTTDKTNELYKIVCYFGSWAGNRYGDGYMTPDDLDPQACTHLIYAFALLQDNEITTRDSFIDFEDNWGKGFYKKFNNLRKKNPKLKTLLGIGEWQDGMKTGNIQFSYMASEAATRKVFVESVVNYLKKYDFNGLDLVWEYPVVRGGDSRELKDKENYVLLLKELKAAFKPDGFLLSVGVAANKDVVEVAYDVPQIFSYADIVNVMTYDFHGTWESRTGHNSPLYSRPDEPENYKYLTIDYAIRDWIKRGADKKKMTLGIPMYGRCYRLEDKNNPSYGAPAPNAGLAGPFTQKPGMQGYNELCVKIKEEMWAQTWSEFHHAPHAYRGDQWCSFDEENSVKRKTEYMKAIGLGGVMVWSLDTDDFKGLCSKRKFTLLSAIVDEIKIDKKDPVMPSTPKWNAIDTTTPIVIQPTQDPRLSDICQKEGLIKYPGKCEIYIQCVSERNGYKAVIQVCSPGTVFNEKRKFCDFPANVPDCSR